MFSPRQQKLLREAVGQYRINEEKFAFFIEDSELRMVYKPEGFHFRIVVPQVKLPQADLFIYYTPDTSGIVLNPKKEIHHFVKTWDDVEASLESWLDWLKQEYEISEDSLLRSTDKLGRKLNKLTDNLIAKHNTEQALPSLAHLHPTIQNAAGSRFATAHYSDAILAACTALDKAVQAKVQRPDLNGKQLMDVSFTPKNPVLRLSQQDNEQTGFMLLYQGVMLAIRNHYAHNLTEIDPARALEWLGFISALFYKLDEAQSSVTPPTP
jgi:uncharacterized protein (TIGR02391 family)